MFIEPLWASLRILFLPLLRVDGMSYSTGDEGYQAFFVFLHIAEALAPSVFYIHQANDITS
jgi:hypothetical protein